MGHIQNQQLVAYKWITYKPIISGLQMDDIQTNNKWHTNGLHTNQ